MPNNNMCVLVPVASTLERKCRAGLDVLASRGYTVRFLFDCSAVDQARNALATWAMDEGFAETLWIDSDTVFDPVDVEKLRDHNLPITCGLYPKKGVSQFACKFLEGGKKTFGKNGGLLEIEYVGLGFCHVRREVYDAIETKIKLPRCGGNHDGRLTVPYFIPSIATTVDGGHVYLAEDSSFLHRARVVGFKIMADTTIKLGHEGKKTYTWDDFALQQYDELELNIPAA
jgi:hypothetical protein